jgi:hypothetical protein
VVAVSEHAGCDRIEINLRAEIDRLRAELSGERRAYDSRAMHWDALKERAEQAESAIARVRELCGQCACIHGTCLACDIFDAIEGE